MKTTCRILLTTGLALAAGPLFGQMVSTNPNLGYLYPAGGKRGTTVEVIAGGQRLNGVKEVIVTGEGVEAEVVRHYRMVRNLNGDQRKLLTKMMQERKNELTGGAKKPVVRPKAGTYRKKPASSKKATPGKKTPAKKTTPPAKKKQTSLGLGGSVFLIATETKPKTDSKSKTSSKTSAKTDPKAKTKTDPKKKEAPPVKLPPHPLLEDIDKKSLRELEVIQRTFQRTNRNQLNPQISEMVKIRIKIAADAAPGDRSIRLVTPNGLTNPLCFQVGALREWSEQEPNEPRVDPKLPPVKPLTLPVTINGQVLPGDVDRIKFHARKGERVVVDARARQLIPYLADAVPGWFQMVVTVYDEKGTELAFADDYRHHPDPLTRFDIPADGTYQLEVRDSIFRGRQDFVYRIRLGQVPVITEMFPLGTEQGRVTKAKVRGWNLPATTVTLDPSSSGGPVRKTALVSRGLATNSVSYAVDKLPNLTEAEPNDNRQKPQAITLPRVINGRIGEPGDIDLFRFHGRKGQEIVAEVMARRLNSPLDSKLSILDSRGKSLSHNDDFMEKDGHLHMGEGLITHHADSYLRVKLPADGSYFVLVGDSQNHGGSACAYRLRLSSPQPRFDVSVTPSALMANVGGHTPLRFHVDRQDGFDGPVDIEMADAPKHWKLHGARILPGCDQVRATLEIPRKKNKQSEKPIEVTFRAVASFGGKTLQSSVEPADDRMQAFLWRHLVPADQFLVKLRNKGWPPVMTVDTDGAARLKPGQTTDVRIKVEGRNLPLDVKLIANEPPPGVVVEDFGIISDGFILKLRAEKTAKPGLAGNLIIEGWMQQEAKPGKKAPRPYLMGFLPAVPFVVEDP